jgi:hypothetical protein
MRVKTFVIAASVAACCAPAYARVTKIVIDQTSPAFCKGQTCASFGAGQYEIAIRLKFICAMP